MQLVAAVAAHAEQGVAGEAFGVDSGQYRFAIAYIAHGEDHMLLVGLGVLEAVHIEFAPGGGEAGRLYVAY
jgi:hypothetical protein